MRADVLDWARGKPKEGARFGCEAVWNHTGFYKTSQALLHHHPKQLPGNFAEPPKNLTGTFSNPQKTLTGAFAHPDKKRRRHFWAQAGRQA